MKVLLQRNITKLGQIGDVVDVRPGYARNYLIPQRLAVQPTESNIKAVESEKAKYLEELAREKADTVAQADALRGMEVTISARANEAGHLYGSVGPAQICEALAAEGAYVDSKNIVLDAPIHQLDKYDITVRFAEDVTAMIHVWVVPSHDSDIAAAPAEADETPVAEDEPQAEDSTATGDEES